MENKIVHLLLIEDDDVAAEAVERALRRAGISNPIHRAQDGLQALDMLRGTDDKPRLPRPYLILLDLRMPRMNGLEFLEELRGDLELHDSVVFVLTTSDDENDLVAAYQRHVAGYIVKARAGDDFADLIRLLSDYWQVVELPDQTNG